MIANIENITHLEMFDSHKNGIRNSMSREIDNFKKGKTMHRNIINKFTKKSRVMFFLKIQNNNLDICILKPDIYKKWPLLLNI